MKGCNDALMRRNIKNNMIWAQHTVSQKSMQLAALGKLI